MSRGDWACQCQFQPGAEIVVWKVCRRLYIKYDRQLTQIVTYNIGYVVSKSVILFGSGY